MNQRARINLALFDFFKNFLYNASRGRLRRKYMKLLALDCSTKATGVAIFENKKLLGSSVITASSTDLIKRIHKMVDTID